MQVIAGSARRIPLKTLEGMNTRPTQNRIKETLFNMIQNQIPGCYFLDLFAGSGAIGIEALSRGASHCDFVEQSKEAALCIKENLQKTHLTEKGVLHTRDVISYLSCNTAKRPYDIIFMDPPYRMEWEKKVLQALKDSIYLSEETLIIIEASSDTDFSYLSEEGYEVIKIKQYKTNQHVFVQKAVKN